MRPLLIVLSVMAVLFVAGFLLVPLIAAHLPAVVGALGVVLLLAAAFNRRRSCDGVVFHCTGCKHN